MTRIFNTLCLTIAILSLPSSYALEPRRWFSKEVAFSDWRNVPQVQYSSNAVVANYYSGGRSKYLRQENLAEIQGRLGRGDTLTVGLDYYALFPITLPLPLAPEVQQYLANGGVVIVRLTK